MSRRCIGDVSSIPHLNLRDSKKLKTYQDVCLLANNLGRRDEMNNLLDRVSNSTVVLIYYFTHRML